MRYIIATVAALLAGVTLYPAQGNAKTISGKKLSPAVVPLEFQGEWNEDLEACGTGLNDSRLIIERDTIRFYESTGDVLEVILHNKRAITVTASYAGEGQVWEATNRFVLWGSNALNDNTDGGKYVRYKCP